MKSKNFNSFGERKFVFSNLLTIEGKSEFLELDLEINIPEVGTQPSSTQLVNPGVVPELEMPGELLVPELEIPELEMPGELLVPEFEMPGELLVCNFCEQECEMYEELLPLPRYQKRYLDSARNLASTRHHDHAAAIQIQSKFRSWKTRKDFLIIQQQIVKIQARVRGHQVRRNYKKIWRQKQSGLHRFKSEALTRGASSMLNIPSKHYRRNGDTLTNNYQRKFSVVPGLGFISSTKADKNRVTNDARLTCKPQKNLYLPLTKDLLQNYAQGVGSQPFPSFSSTQPDNLGNIPKKWHEILGELSTNSFGERKEFGSHLPIQEELQAWRETTCVGPTSTQSIDVASESILDYTNEFTIHEIFESREALIQWTRVAGKKNGFVIVISKSDSGNDGQKARITLCCERSGQYRSIGKNKGDKNEKQWRNISTKKCGCPFMLKGHNSGSDGKWTLKVENGVHNHPIKKPLEGRSYEGRLSKEEILLLKDMSKSGARPKDILVTLKNRDVNNISTMKQIYNARQRYNKVKEMAEKPKMQQLLSKLSEHKYIERHRSFGNTNIIKDLFWAHPSSIDLLHTFPCVLLIDCTHKTNRCNLPLLEIVGVTSTNMKFAAAFAYLESEQEDNYTWALERLRSVMDDNAFPTIILGDKQLALMNAIERVFPTAKHLLCRWHVNRNVFTNCRKLFAINETWDRFIMSWNMVLLSPSEDEFTDRLHILKQEFSCYPQAVEYVINTWLKNYKERFVSAWTDKIMHFGNLSENRVESSHSRLQKQLHSNQGNFETSWAKIHSLLELQHANIVASLEKCLIVVQDQFKLAEFEELRGLISIDALHMVLNESKRANSFGVDASTCRCIIRHTHGLPCAHEIAEFKRESRPIPLESIDSYWRTLHLVSVSKKQKAMLGCESVFVLIAERFKEVDDDTRLHILKKLTEIANPQSTFLVEPESEKEIHDQPNSKGLSMRPPTRVKNNGRAEEEVCVNKRLKSNAFVSSFPVGLQSYIYDIKNVTPDGNCGFRAIADLMGFGENGWLQVRKDLLKELISNVEHYSHLYGTFGRVSELIRALSYFESCPSFGYWMTMPEMGHLIASAYNVVLFQLSLQQCLTFLPLRSILIPTDSLKEIAIGFVNNNHFVEVYLVHNHPVPPIAASWYKFRHCCAMEWDTIYISRIQHFKNIIGNDVATNEIIDVDSD